MQWEWNKTEKQKTNNPDRAPRKSKSTGVTPLRRTISGYSHDKASKSEIMGARMNLKGCNLESFGGGNGDALSPGEISACSHMQLRPPKSAIVLWCASGSPITDNAIKMAKEATKALSDYKHTCDQSALRMTQRSVLQMFVTQAVRAGWDKEKRKRGILTRCVEVVIDDICCPRKYCDLSDNAWSKMIGLDNHLQWTRVWKGRYRLLRNVIQDMDIAGDEALGRV